jgi:steroid 5-alpha reductase family enzyme
VGIFLISPGVLTILSPVVMVYLLAFGSGKKVLEKHLAGRPGFEEYQRRTSGFFPLPPKP